jgi:alanyl-tRNA synthetase
MHLNPPTVLHLDTRKLYYTDSYLQVFDAQVLAAEDEGRRVYLDRTAFYPTSGGQQHDLGTLNGIAVVDVIDEGDRVAHLVAEPVPETRVEGKIDWTRRYDHMQQHTGQHLLSAVFVQLFSIPTLSFHMGDETSTVELGAQELSEQAISAVESRCNELVREARPVRIEFAEAEEAQGLRKASTRSGTLRVIDIAGVDRSACGGTHLNSTAEIGPVQLRKQERIRGNIRIEFLCGERAIRQARRDFLTLNELAKVLAVPFGALPEQAGQLRHRWAAAEKERQRLAIELAQRQGIQLHAEQPAMADGMRRVLLAVDEIDEVVRVKAQAFTRVGRAIMVLFAPATGSVLVSCSPDSGEHAGNRLREMLAAAGRRGGGSATLSQGSLSDPKILGQLTAALGFSETASPSAQNSGHR